MRVARADGSSAGAGVARANEFLAESGGQDVLLNSSVAPEATGEEIHITVSGNAITLMPVFDLSVTQTAAGPVGDSPPGLRHDRAAAGAGKPVEQR